MTTSSPRIDPPHRRRAAWAMLGIACVACGIWAQTPALPDPPNGEHVKQSSSSPPLMLSGKPVATSASWEHIVSIADHLKKACPWSDTRPSTPEDWVSIVEAAIVLQREDPLVVYAALVVYMQDATKEGHRAGFMGRFDSWSKPMIVLRVMFDIPLEDGPRPFSSDEIVERIGRPSPCGGLPPMRDGDARGLSSYGSPVIWSPDGPTVSAYRAKGFMSTGPAPQPQSDYLFFLQHYGHRSGLREWLDSAKARDTGKKLD